MAWRPARAGCGGSSGGTASPAKRGGPRGAGVRRRDRHQAAGARVLYLPPYSPDFNPIERAFAKLKALLRTAAARTVPDLRDAITRAFNRFNPQECRNYLAAAGYEEDLAVAT